MKYAILIPLVVVAAACADWLTPENMGEPINGPDVESWPAITDDGARLVLSSTRAPSLGEMDLFISFYSGDTWSNPTNLGDHINTSEIDAGGHLTPDGNELYFYSHGLDPSDQADIFVSYWDGSTYGAPTDLGPAINSQYNDKGPALSGDGNVMYFCSNREPPGNRLNLYMSEKEGGEWQPAVKLPPVVGDDDYHEYPAWSNYDGTELYFSSGRPGGFGEMDLWVATRDGDDWNAPVNLGEPFNTSSRDAGFAMSHDGHRAYWASDREPGYGDYDIWMVMDDHDANIVPISFGGIKAIYR